MTSPQVPQTERIARLRLARSERIGPVTFSQLLDRYGSAATALSALPDLTRRNGGPGFRPASTEQVEAELARGEACGARLVVIGDRDYPAILAAVDPPPPVLWIRGHHELLRRDAVAVVGARIASAGGQRLARGLAAQLGEAGLVVVSGMARGIDGAAHQGALQTGTIAVLAGGIDDIYPPEHDALYGRIVEQGLVVSETPPGIRAKGHDFPRRNRIISGLSLGVVVVEAELKSGSLITARLAAEQGRDVFAVPGSPLDPRSKGPNTLLRDGAILCESAADVLDAIAGSRPLPHPQMVERPTPEAPDLPLAARDLGPDLLRAVEGLLSPVPTPRDDLARALALPVSVVSGALLELSLAGRARLLPGGLASS